MAEKFSVRLHQAANAPDKSIRGIINVFAGNSFAMLFLLLMAIPALPLPTGGVTHVFEIIVMLLAIEFIFGKGGIWLPKRLLKVELPDKLWTKTMPTIEKIEKKISRFSRPRLSLAMTRRWFRVASGLFVLAFTVFAFLAPPFSGLDTIPSLGVVIISLGLILEDFLLSVVGAVVGLIGVGLVVLLSSLALQLF